MRVTNRMIIDTVIRDIFRNTEQLQDVQESLTSGKKINKPSDDPLGASQVLDYRKSLSGMEQFKKNIAWGKSWLNLTDSALNQASNILTRAKEIAISQSSATATADSRAASAVEVDQLYQQMLQISSTKLNGRYIFAGQKTDTSPFAQDGSYNGDSGAVQIMIGPGTEMEINSTGDKIFKGAVGGNDIFSLLEGLKTALENNAPATIGEQLNGIDDAQKVVNAERAGVGGKVNRLNIMDENLTDLKLHTEELLSDTESVDLTKAAIELADRTNLFQASISVISGVIQPSLIDFLR